MGGRIVRSPKSPVLIAAGIAFLLLATAAMKAQSWYDYRVPVVVLAIPILEYAILGTALLIVAILRSRFAGVVAVIVATFITFEVVAGAVLPLAFGGSARVNWLSAINLAIAGAILGTSAFPWNWPANKLVLFWMGLTFGTLTLLFGTVVLLARF